MKKILSVLAIVILFSACKKGDTGEPGTPGTNGTNGNANVQNKTFTVTPAQWQSAGTGFIYYNINLNEITTGIADSGAVVVYLESGNSFYQLPRTIYNIGGQSFSYTDSFSAGNLEIDISSEAAFSLPTTNYIFRVVIIEGHFKIKSTTPFHCQALPDLS